MLRSVFTRLGCLSRFALVVDAAALTAFDSSALAVLLECRRAALSDGKSFSVKALPAALSTLAGLYGVLELLQPATAD